MTDGVIVKTNLPEFKRQLVELGERFEKRIGRRAARGAGVVFRDAARNKSGRPNRRTGVLRAAIYVGSSRSPRGTVAFKVSVRATAGQTKKGRDPFYWRFLEGGWIPRGPGKRFRGGARTRAVLRQRALKGGARKVSYPFLLPSFTANKDRALQAFIDVMDDGIAEENRNKA